MSFKYDNNNEYALQDIELNIDRGEFIAIVGPTGSGKSTLADLILGLLKPTNGNIFVNDQELHENPEILKHWQANIAHVQSYALFPNLTIEKNIAFGIPESEIDLKRLKMCSQLANISDLIQSSVNGYKTVVGERGIKLSGGQRQRIGIARALYRDSELLLLDEATSALDNLTELSVMDSIKKIRNSMTIVVIAHRLSTIKHCDRIVVLDKGKINGIGNYGELLANNEIFSNLVNSKAFKK